MDITGFHALSTGVVEQTEGGAARLSVLDLGTVKLPSGLLGACDPFVSLDEPLPLEIPEAGEFPVKVTLADVSEEQDGSHIREAYLSVLLAEGEAVELRPAVAVFEDEDEDDDEDEEEAPQLEDEGDPIFGIPVDSGTVAFVDAIAAETGLPEDADETVFDSGEDDSWFNQMDAEQPLPAGYANVVMPLAENGENVVLCHSGWGDGFYPVLATFDANGAMLGIHIDLRVVGDPGYPARTQDEDDED